MRMSKKIHNFAVKFKVPLIIITVLLLLENALLAYNNLQNRYPILGLKLNNQSLFQKDRSELEYIAQHQYDPGRPARFIYGSQIFSIKPSDIGANVDPVVTANQVLKVGKTGSLIARLITQNKALMGLENQPIIGTLSSSLLAIKLLDIGDSINQDAVPIMPNFMDNYSKTIPAQDGVKIDTNKLSVLIANRIFSPQDTPIAIPTIKTTTLHQETELSTIRQEIPNLVKKPISISSGGLTLTLSTEDLLSLLTVKERPDPKDPKKLRLVLRLDDKKLNQKLGDFAVLVQAKTQAEFDEYDARTAIYSEFLSPDNRSLVNIPTGSRINVLGIQNGGPKIAYLTFDDGTNDLYHPMILDILKQYGIKATFFLIGANVQKSPEIVQRTVAEGHVIGDHTQTHAFLPSLSPVNILTELKGGKETLTPFNDGQPITLFRPPYGGTNKTVTIDSTLLGMKQVLWDVDPQDWTEPTVNLLVSRVVDHTYPGAIILMHSNHLTTVRALPNIIQSLQAKGYSFQTL